MVRRKFQYQNQAPITLGSEDTFEISSPLVATWERVLCTKCREFARTLTRLQPVKNYHPAHPKGRILKGLASPVWKNWSQADHVGMLRYLRDCQPHFTAF